MSSESMSLRNAPKAALCSATDHGNRFINGYCRQRIAEQREEGRQQKNCADRRCLFFPFSFSDYRVYGGLICGFPDWARREKFALVFSMRLAGRCRGPSARAASDYEPRRQTSNTRRQGERKCSALGQLNCPKNSGRRPGSSLIDQAAGSGGTGRYVHLQRNCLLPRWHWCP
jgi:hypothetical protein